MALANRIDADRAGPALQRWLRHRLDGAVVVSDVSVPSSNGLSCETVLFTTQQGRFVARVAPADGSGLFPTYWLEDEARIMRALAGNTAVPAPRVVGVELDPGRPGWAVPRHGAHRRTGSVRRSPVLPGGLGARAVGRRAAASGGERGRDDRRRLAGGLVRTGPPAQPRRGRRAGRVPRAPLHLGTSRPGSPHHRGRARVPAREPAHRRTARAVLGRRPDRQHDLRRRLHRRRERWTGSSPRSAAASSTSPTSSTRCGCGPRATAPPAHRASPTAPRFSAGSRSCPGTRRRTWTTTSGTPRCSARSPCSAPGT